MKNLIIIVFLSSLVYTTRAQTKVHQSLHKSVHDDGKTMHISINGTVNNQTAYYDKTFDVNGWDKLRKDALLKHITDSLGVQDPPSAPQPPAPPTPPGGAATRKETHVNSDIDDDGKTLHLRFSGSAKNAPFEYDRTFDVKGMSKQQKTALIKRVTDSLGISGQVQLGTH